MTTPPSRGRRKKGRTEEDVGEDADVGARKEKCHTSGETECCGRVRGEDIAMLRLTPPLEAPYVTTGRRRKASEKAHVLADLQERLLIYPDITLTAVFDDLVELFVIALLSDLFGNFSQAFFPATCSTGSWWTSHAGMKTNDSTCSGDTHVIKAISCSPNLFSTGLPASSNSGVDANSANWFFTSSSKSWLRIFGLINSTNSANSIELSPLESSSSMSASASAFVRDCPSDFIAKRSSFESMLPPPSESNWSNTSRTSCSCRKQEVRDKATGLSECRLLDRATGLSERKPILACAAARVWACRRVCAGPHLVFGQALLYAAHLALVRRVAHLAPWLRRQAQAGEPPAERPRSRPRT